MSWQILQGDCLEVLRGMESASVQCCVTSPPYWGLRDYGVVGQLGLERTPEEYVAKMVEVFREVRRVLRDDGTLWLNIGDSYSGSWARSDNPGGKGGLSKMQVSNHGSYTVGDAVGRAVPRVVPDGLKAKDLCGIPWMVAFALRADGWYLRQDIIWSKPNPMPESVTDRCTKAHEYIFLLSKSARYFYDADAIKEECEYREDDRPFGGAGGNRHGDEGRVYKNHRTAPCGREGDGVPPGQSADTGFLNGRFYMTRNKRSVWEITTKPYSEAHFATFPPDLIEPCIKAGSREGDTILDPFNGAGTTGLVATRFQRNYIGIELNQEYCEMSRRRIEQDAPLFNSPNLATADLPPESPKNEPAEAL